MNNKNSLTEKYSNSPIMRGILATSMAFIPGGSIVSSVIDIFVTDKAGKIKELRIVNMLSSLGDKLKSLDDSFVDNQFFESEEWLDIFSQALIFTSQTRHIEKINLYTSILKGTIINPELIEDAESYLSVINELSLPELLYAQKLFAHQSLKIDKENYQEVESKKKKYEELEKYLQVNNLDKMFISQRIAKTGLIKEITGTFAGYSGGDYKITDTFKKLMDYISEH